MENYNAIILAIVSEQEVIIGPLARQQANSVEGLTVDFEQKSVQMTREPKDIMADLVESYRLLFGNISVEVCKTAAHHAAPNLADAELPEVLRG